jgi:tripartite-type tricarboxylate transporter receptor subunit TctC
MTRIRLSTMAALLAAATASLSNVPASAQGAYPDKPVHLLVGRPPGGVADIAARVIGQHLSRRWKEQVVVENRPGGGGVIAVRAALQAPADGASVLVAADSDFTINRFVLKSWQPSYDTDIIPVARLTFNPVVLVAPANAPYSTVQQLIQAAKADPGGITFATAGTGSSPHLVGEYFGSKAGIDIRHIPYNGGPGAAAAAAGGHVGLAVIAVSSAAPLVQSGNVKVIGLSTKSRLPFLPDWPTIAEGGIPDFEANIWTGLFIKAGTPPGVIEKLDNDVRAVLADPVAVKELEDVGAIPAPLFGKEFATEIARDQERNGALVRRLKILTD